MKRAVCVLGVALLVVLCAPVGVQAASVASGTGSYTGGADETRCSFGANVASGSGASSVWRVAAKCYLKDSLGAKAGTTESLTVGTNTNVNNWFHIYFSGSDTYYDFGAATVSGNNGTIYYGPQSGTPMGNIPAQAVAYVSWCGTGQYVCNKSSAIDASVVAGRFHCTTVGQMSITDAVAPVDPVDTQRQGRCHMSRGKVSDLTFDWPTDWYPGGATGSIQPFCNGTTADVLSPTTMSTVVRTGDTMSLLFQTEPTWPAEIQIKFIGEPEWTVVRSDFYVGLNPQPFQYTKGASTLNAVEAQFLSVRCRNTPVVAPGLWEMKFLYMVGDGIIGDDDDVEPQRPCKALRIYSPPDSEPWDSGDVLTYEGRYAPLFDLADEEIDLLEVGYSPGGTYGDNRDPYTWTTWDSTFSPPWTDTYDVTTTEEGNDLAEHVKFRCTDAQGRIFISPADSWGVGGVGGIPGNEDEGIAGRVLVCLEGMNIGLAPSSWVPGLLRGGVCMLEVAVVPTDMAGWMDEQQTTLNEVAPFSFVGDAVEFFDEATDPSAAAGSGCIGNFAVGSMTSSALCFRQTDVDNMLDSQGWVRPLIWWGCVGMVILLFVLGTFRMFTP